MVDLRRLWCFATPQFTASSRVRGAGLRMPSRQRGRGPFPQVRRVVSVDDGTVQGTVPWSWCTSLLRDLPGHGCQGFMESGMWKN